MTAFSFSARLHLDVNSTLALSLPQSFVAAKRRQKPAPSSEGAEAAPPHTTDFPRRKKCSNRFSVNAFTGRRYNPSVFSACKTSRKSSSPYTGEPRFALSRATVMRTRILSVTPLNPLGVTAPLMNKGSQENGVNAIPCRRYNPSVKPTACQLPLHSWLSSAASGGCSEKGKPLPSASARANSRSTSGRRRGSRDLRFRRLGAQTVLTVLKIKKVSTGACSNEKGACSNGKRADTHKRVPAWALLPV